MQAHSTDVRIFNYSNYVITNAQVKAVEEATRTMWYQSCTFYSEAIFLILNTFIVTFIMYCRIL